LGCGGWFRIRKSKRDSGEEKGEISGSRPTRSMKAKGNCPESQRKGPLRSENSGKIGKGRNYLSGGDTTKGVLEEDKGQKKRDISMTLSKIVGERGELKEGWPGGNVMLCVTTSCKELQKGKTCGGVT